jgi:hypothetical protein
MYCIYCDQEKTTKEFYETNKSKCIACVSDYQKNRRNKFRKNLAICSECGVRAPKEGAKRCQKCLTRMKSTHQKHSDRCKIKAIEFMGNKCHRCGQSFDIPDVYDFHHTNGDKGFGISDALGKKGWASIKQELSKCVMLCAICHRIVHYEERKASNISMIS